MNAVEWDSSSQQKTPSLSNIHLTFTTSLLLHPQKTNEWQWTKTPWMKMYLKVPIRNGDFPACHVRLFLFCVFFVRGNSKKDDPQVDGTINLRISQVWKPSSFFIVPPLCFFLGGGCCNTYRSNNTYGQGKQNSERIYIKIKRLYWWNLPILNLTGFQNFQVAIKILKRKSSISVGKISDDDFPF